MAEPSESAWQLLAASAGQDLTTRESGAEVTGGPILHSIDATGGRHLLIPLASDAGEVADSGSRGVTVITRQLLGQNGELRFVDVQCTDRSLHDLFSIVCDELIGECVRHPESVREVVPSVLTRWRELLGPGARHLLSEQQIKGLLAELHILEELAAVSPARAVASWTGPARGRHDFTGSTVSCEVKASSLVDEVKVHVNGLTQLEHPPGSRLLLAVERFESVPSGGDSLAAAVARLVEAGVDRHSLLSTLLAAGVPAADLDVYSRFRFRSLEKRLYTVDDAFPALTRRALVDPSLAERVSGVEYVLNLIGPDPRPHSDDERRHLMESILG